MNSELNRLHVWFNINKLSLHISMTNYMMLSNSRSTQAFNISINGANIRRFCTAKYLGVCIDDELNSKNTLHIYAMNKEIYICSIQN